MPTLDNTYYNDVTLEQQKVIDCKVDKAIKQFFITLDGVDRTTLLQALHQIEIMSNDICVVKSPNMTL